jgi:hypothetical protein
MLAMYSGRPSCFQCGSRRMKPVVIEGADGARIKAIPYYYTDEDWALFAESIRARVGDGHRPYPLTG